MAAASMAAATSLSLLMARLTLAWRLLLGVMRLPAAVLPAASRLSSEDLVQLLWKVLLPQRPRKMAAAPGRPKERVFASSGGSGADDTPASDEGVSDAMSDSLGAAAAGIAVRSTAGAARSGEAAPSDTPRSGSVVAAAPSSPALSHARANAKPRESSVLAVDVGGTRTKFLLVEGDKCKRLPPAPTARIWQNAELSGPDKFEPATAPLRMRTYLRECGVSMERIGRLAFSIPGTVDLAERTTSSVVKNTPSMSPKFRGFDFKLAFRDVCPTAKVSATADNLAAALGVACQQPELRSALVVVLGTAPAVATLFRDPHKKVGRALVAPPARIVALPRA